MLSIKVIHLERSSARGNAFIKNNQNLNYEFIEAVDGRSLSTSHIKESGLFADQLDYTSGAYGAALSHLKLWQEAIDKQEIITIAEDDAIFRKDFEERAQNLIQNLGDDWDLILWGWNFDATLSLNIMPGVSSVIMQTNQEMMRVNTEVFKEQTEEAHLHRLDTCFGIPAYSISPKGAEKFKSECFPLVPFEMSFHGFKKKLKNNGIDISMNKIYKNTITYACLPPMVITPNDHEISTIQNDEKLMKKNSRSWINLFRKLKIS